MHFLDLPSHGYSHLSPLSDKLEVQSLAPGCPRRSEPQAGPWLGGELLGHGGGWWRGGIHVFQDLCALDLEQVREIESKSTHPNC